MTGEDSKVNTWNTLYDTISALLFKIQGNTDLDISYLDSLKANLWIVDLAKGTHTFYAQKIMTAIYPRNPTTTEIYNYQ